MIFKEKVIDKIIYFLFVCLFILTPILMTSVTSELFEFNKMLFIYLITGFIFYFWILKMILQKKFLIKKTSFDIFIILFLISQILSTIFSIDIHTSIFGYYGRFNGGLLSIICYLILLYALISNLKKEQIFSLFKLSLITSFLVILWGLSGKLGYDLTCFIFTEQLNNNCWTDQFKPSERMFSTLGQPNWLGAYLAINFFIGGYFLLKAEKKFNFGIYWLYLFFNFSAILFTRSRSAFLATTVSFFIFIFLFFLLHLRNNRLKLNQKFFTSILFIFLSILLPILIFKTGIEKIDRYLTFNLIAKKKNIKTEKKIKVVNMPIKVTESLDIRKIVWQGAIELGKKYPLFGSGVETFAYSYYFVRPKEHNLTSEWDYLYNKAHNEFLNYLATTGFFGLGSYLLLIFFIIYYFLKKIFQDKKEKNILEISLFISYLTILITNFFGFSTTTINLFFYLIPGFIILLNDQNKKDYQYFKINLNELSFFQTLIIFLFSLSIIYYSLFIFKYWLADNLYAKANIFQQSQNYEQAIENLQKALKLKYEPVYLDKLSYNLANLAYLAFYQKEKNYANELIKLSSFYNEQTIKNSSKNVIYLKTKAKNFYLYYQITLDSKYIIEGLKALDLASILSPSDPKIPHSKAVYYLILFDLADNQNKKREYQEEVLKNLDLAILLKPDFKEGYFLKGKFFKILGEKEEAKKIFNYILKNIDPLDQETKEELKDF